MTEDAMVMMLVEVAAGAVRDDRDLDLARGAARWAHEIAGWRAHPEGGLTFERNGLHFWVLSHKLALEVRVGPGRGIWHTHLRARIDHLGHGLNVLAAEDLILAEYSPMGRNVRENWADVCAQSAARLQAKAAASGDVLEAWEMQVRADTLDSVAAQARAFPSELLAVIT